jgi:hypothetical protein
VIKPLRSSRRTRSRQARADSATRSESSWLVMRPSSLQDLEDPAIDAIEVFTRH